MDWIARFTQSYQDRCHPGARTWEKTGKGRDPSAHVECD